MRWFPYLARKNDGSASKRRLRTPKYGQLDAIVTGRAARKAGIGRLAESLAEDVKLVAARHQHAASRMEVQLRVGRLETSTPLSFVNCTYCPAFHCVICSSKDSHQISRMTSHHEGCCQAKNSWN